MTPRSFQADTPLQALLVEQALLLARQLEQTAADAPDGQVLAKVEAAAVPAGRELTRKAVEATLQAQAEQAEKKGAPGRRCPGCGKCRWPKGHAERAIVTAAGDARLRRLYLVCPRCGTSAHPLDDRLGLAGFLSPHAQRLVCLAGASWSFDRAAAHLKELCGLSVCDNTIRAACHGHGGAMRDWQRDDPAAAAAFQAAAGDVEFQTDGTAVNTTAGWREMRLSVFAKRGRGRPATGRDDWQQRGLPAPHVRVLQAGVRTGDQLGPAWRRQAARLGLRQASALTAIADGARWIWRQLAAHLPGAAGVLDIYHASARLWAAANAHFGEGTAAAGAWVEARRAELLAGGAAGLLAGLGGDAWAELRGYFEPHRGHTDYAGRLACGQSIGSGLVEGACKQVIGRRLKQTGARWKVRRVERMATLCAVQASGQWETYWDKAL